MKLSIYRAATQSCRVIAAFKYFSFGYFISMENFPNFIFSCAPEKDYKGRSAPGTSEFSVNALVFN